MAPASVRVRMYHVGFGDCFLLSLAWARAPGVRARERRGVAPCSAIDMSEAAEHVMAGGG